MLLSLTRFLESEIELNEIIHEMHVMATVPEYYQILVDLRCVQSLLQLVAHDNTGNPVSLNSDPSSSKAKIVCLQFSFFTYTISLY